MNLRCITFFFNFLTGILGQLSTSDPEVSNKTDFQLHPKDPNKDYVVWNPFCRIPRLDPYHESIKKYISGITPYKCSDTDPLTSVTFDSITQKHTLQVNSNVTRQYVSAGNESQLQCCYILVTRSYFDGHQDGTHDDRYDLKPTTCFADKIVLPADSEYVYVYCTWMNKKIYKTVYFLVVDKKPKSAPSNGKSNKKYSLLLFGIDSLSRQNFVRTLPKTRDYIEKRGWLPLEGYTKVADNTFPNLIPVLSGMTADQFNKLCNPYPKHKLDDCPFIWKNFSDEGYLTVYTEDVFWMGTFNYARYGFVNSPTDFYSRPIFSAANDLLRDSTKSDVIRDFCLGYHPQCEYFFRFQTEFIQRFHDRPYFNLFWSNSFSHEDVRLPSLMDERVKSFLEDIEPYLNSTVVVFFSDHGPRFGDMRSTFQGWLEDRMPFIYFHLPPSLKADHPDWYLNLQANKNKLASPFDLHATLQQVLYGQVLQTPAGCPKCGSLLDRVPQNRSCEDAAITSAWCTCSVTDESQSVADWHVTAPVYDFILIINFNLQNGRKDLMEGYRCADLSFSKIVGVRKAGQSMENIIAFETEPGKGIFEITVAKDSVQVHLDRIYRINKYGNQSSCVTSSPLLKLFCFCEKI